MSTTVTQHTNGFQWLYERDDKKVEVYDFDHYLLKKGYAYIDWDTEQLIMNGDKAHQLNDEMERKRKQKVAEDFEKRKLDSLVS